MSTIAAIHVDEQSPRQVLLDALNRCDEMRSVVVLYVTHDDQVTINRSTVPLDALTMLGMLVRQVARE